MKLPDEPQSSGSNAFLKLKSGESVSGFFQGDVVTFNQHFVAGKGLVCTGSACPVCKEGDKATWRFRLNLAVQGPSGYEMKIFEQGKRVYNQIVSINNETPIETVKVAVKRIGEAKQTTYQIIPSAKAMTPDENKALKALSLHSLLPKVDAAPTVIKSSAPGDMY